METVSANKGEKIDSYISTITNKMDVAKRTLSSDQRELRRIDAEIAILEGKIEKSQSYIDQKKKLRDETKEQLKQVEQQFTDVSS